MMELKVSFTNQAGHQLAARLVLPEGEPVAFALFAHCFTCTKNFNSERNICAQLNAAQIAVLLFDFTGLGESKGDFADSNFSTNLQDIYAAVNYLSANYQPPKILIGHSLGGTAVVCAANQIPSVKAVATIGSPASAGHVSGLLKGNLEAIEKDGSAEVDLGGRNFLIKKQFLDDISLHHVSDHLKNYHHALLILHSPQDTVVAIENAAEIYTLARHPKSFISLDRAEHLLPQKEDAAYAGRMIAAWLTHYLEN